MILDATKEVLAAANAKKIKDKRAFMAMLQHQNNEGNYPWSGRRSAGAQPDGGRGEATEGEGARGGVRRKSRAGRVSQGDGQRTSVDVTGRNCAASLKLV